MPVDVRHSVLLHFALPAKRVFTSCKASQMRSKTIEALGGYPPSQRI